MSDRIRGDGADSRFDPADRGGRSITLTQVVVVVGLVLAVVSIGYAVTVPQENDQSTAFFLLTKNETGGLVAKDYPTEFSCGESEGLVVGITNHEQEFTEYTTVVELQRVQYDDSRTNSTVLDERELHRFRASVPNNETRYVTYDATPTLVGETLRLVFLLYKGTVPDEPTTTNAYRSLHLDVSVDPTNQSGSGSGSTRSC